MSKQDSQARSEQLKAEMTAIDKDLGRAGTHRMLYFRAYTMLTSWLADVELGTRSVPNMLQRKAILSELLSTHAHRIARDTGVSGPAARDLDEDRR
jgi:hypothetical protein